MMDKTGLLLIEDSTSLVMLSKIKLQKQKEPSCARLVQQLLGVLILQFTTRLDSKDSDSSGLSRLERTVQDLAS